MKRRFLYLLIALTLCASCGKTQSVFENRNEEIPLETEIRIMAVGDNLIHSPIYKSCRTENGYDFSGIYSHIVPYIKDADIAAINQETVFVSDERLYSGYPMFGTPMFVGEAIKQAGFNVVTHATNHAFDKHADAVFETIDFWKKYPEIMYLGIHDSAEDAKKINYFVKNDFKIALLNFTYGLNGFTLPKGKEYLIDLYDSENAAYYVKRAEETADYTVVFIHFGTEYTHTPTQTQKKWAHDLCENGADLIIGAHPHVIQNYEMITSDNGNKAVVFYSLGNFVSNQDSIDKVLGAMADVTVKKSGDKVRTENYVMHPVVTHAGKKYTIYMLKDYTDELAAKHRRCRGLTVNKLKKLFNSVTNL